MEKKIAEAKKADSEFRHVELPVDRFEDGRRLDVFLAGRYPALSRSAWQDRIRRGEVTINHRPIRASRILRESETIRFSYALRHEPDVNTGYTILFEDSSLLVINKPPNLPVHASGSYRKNTLNELLIRDLSDSAGRFICRPVHRLDRETSGIIVYAKSTRAASKLTKSFLSNRVKKEYLALVFGRFPPQRICSGEIGTDPRSAVRKKQCYTENADLPGSVPCRTDFTAEKYFRSLETTPREITLLRARLHTGRMHQIRATLSSLGFPLVGDRLYGPDETIYLRMMKDEETDSDRHRLLLGRTALHCCTMAFPHPDTDEMIEFAVNLPEDLNPEKTGREVIPLLRPRPSPP